MKKPFNPEEWEEPAKQQTPQNTQPAQAPATDASDDIEIVTQRIEAARVDITGDYATWRDEEGKQSLVDLHVSGITSYFSKLMLV